ncbi:MAG: OmpA family protein [Prevotella sp.]|nr:OmpA family protein [Prevotella sp.]
MKKLFFLAAFTLLASSAVTAQEKVSRLQSYNYVEVQGGVEWTATDAKIDKLLSPIGAFSVGRFFTPVVGARLHVSGLEAKGRFEQLDKDYKWNFITTDADLLINISSLFSKNYSRPLNLMFVGGIGLTNAWKNDDMKAIASENPGLAPLAWTSSNRLSHNLRAGLRLETNVTKPFGVSLEVAANSLDDRFNSKTNDADDWMISGMLGLSWRFGHKNQQPTKVVRQIEEEVWVDVPDTIIVKEKRPIVTEEKKKIEEVIFFEICQSDANAAQGTEKAIKDIADLMKTSDDATFTLTGYADKGTGNPTINKMYAQRRADDVTKKLINEHGLDASRLKTDSKGDTVQPFEENDKNRCVIITGEGTFKVTNYEEYDAQKVTTKKVKQTVTREIVEEKYD